MTLRTLIKFDLRMSDEACCLLKCLDISDGQRPAAVMLVVLAIVLAVIAFRTLSAQSRKNK